MQVVGQHVLPQGRMMATGARVSNAYATYPIPEDNPEKFGLILHKDKLRHLEIFKASVVLDGHA